MIAYALIENEQSRTFFEQLYYQYRQHMCWIARQILCDEYLAEDVTAEAFIRIAKKIDFIASLSEKQQRDYIVVILRNSFSKLALHIPSTYLLRRSIFRYLSGLRCIIQHISRKNTLL